MRTRIICFKPERVCTSLVVEMGLENAAVEEVVVEKRQEDDTVGSSQSWRKLSRRPRKSFRGT